MVSFHTDVKKQKPSPPSLRILSLRISSPQSNQPICRDFQNGRCFRTSCRFHHGALSDPTSPAICPPVAGAPFAPPLFPPAHLDALRRALRESKSGEMLTKLPPKSRLTGKSSLHLHHKGAAKDYKVICERKEKLEAYLKEAVHHPELAKHRELKKFLEDLLNLNLDTLVDEAKKCEGGLSLSCPALCLSFCLPICPFM